MEEEEVCSVCFNRSMSMLNGLLICAVCGTQSQSFVEEATDDWEGQQANKVKRAVRFRSEEKPKAAQDMLSIEPLIKAYCRALQATLQVKQMSALGIEFQAVQEESQTEDLVLGLKQLSRQGAQQTGSWAQLQVLCSHMQHFCPANMMLESVARRIWFADLASKRILEPSFIQASNDDVEGAASVVSEVPLEELQSIRHQIHKAVPPERVVVVLYVACLLLRLPVTPMDIQARVLSGALPFTEHLGRAREALDPQDQLGLTALLYRPGVSGAWWLMQDALALARGLQLGLPPINADALALRFCNTLQLPLEICEGVEKVMDVYAVAGLSWCLSSHNLHIPYSKVMAMLVFVARIYFRQLPPGQVSGDDWARWAFQTVHRTQLKHPLTSQADVSQQLKATYGTTKVPVEVAEAQKLMLAISGSHKRDHAELHMPSASTEESVPEPAEDGRSDAFLLTAAASIIWVTPAYLENQITNLKTELLKAERLASSRLVSEGAAEPLDS